MVILFIFSFICILNIAFYVFRGVIMLFILNIFSWNFVILTINTCLFYLQKQGRTFFFRLIFMKILFNLLLKHWLSLIILTIWNNSLLLNLSFRIIQIFFYIVNFNILFYFIFWVLFFLLFRVNLINLVFVKNIMI